MSVSYVCARAELLPSGDPLTMPVYRQLSYRG